MFWKLHTWLDILRSQFWKVLAYYLVYDITFPCKSQCLAMYIYYHLKFSIHAGIIIISIIIKILWVLGRENKLEDKYINMCSYMMMFTDKIIGLIIIILYYSTL